ncbi:MAG: glycosyltransferase family 4 protein [Bacillus sp. (in: Bacteria)]|nr:glycosyltransferase family 4 protein [Bacillus sp. (in: firmicutes)]MCM1425851.1 glycosyltransferase family 4 protein [Eubacterium sp.]
MGYSHEKIMEYIKMDAERVFSPEQQPLDEWRKMLVVVPDLELTGAMTVLMDLLPVFQNRGIFLYILSAGEDGKFREKLIEQGAVVFIRPYVICDSNYRHFLQEAFDFVFLNSSSCFYYAYYFINQPVKVFWWFHETKEQLDTMQTEFLNLRLLSDNFTLLGVTRRVVEGIRERFYIDIENLPMPVRDCYQDSKENREEKALFFMPAAYTYIKGQDILLKAIIMLPKEYLEKAQFVFCGYRLPGQEAFYQNIKEIAQKLPEVVFLDELERSEVYEWYRRCDCVVAPSRVDATPTTIVEAMMHQKLCIVSDAAGISSYMTDCVDGFVFPNGNEQELMKRILLVIEARGELAKVAKAGRKVYEENFSVGAVTGKVDKMIGESGNE